MVVGSFHSKFEINQRCVLNYNDSYPGGGPANPGGGGKGMPGGKPGGRKPGGGPDIPGGAKGMGGRANEGGPTSSGKLSDHRKSKTVKVLLGGIIPIPRPAGIPRPGPTGSYDQKRSDFFPSVYRSPGDVLHSFYLHLRLGVGPQR